MVTKFKTDKEKSILCCIVDNLDSCHSIWAKDVNINLTDYMVHRFAVKQFDVYVGENENELLYHAATDGYTHAVIIAGGTSLGLSDRLFPAIEQKCTEEFFIAGHILDRSTHSYFKNACFELHHQFYIINLKEYALLGFPAVGNESIESYSQLEPLRSVEYQYDDHEIPVWIKTGTEIKTYDTKLHGWNILKIAFENNKTLIDLGESIRDSKKYIYYEHDHVFTRMYSEIKQHQFFCDNFFAGWNSDPLRESIEFDGPVEQYATVGIGFNWIRNLQLIGFTKDTKVIFTDINYNCLMFMKEMVTNWDGKNYAEFYKQNMPIVPNGPITISESYFTQIDEQWKMFLSVFNDWDTVWSQVKKLSYEYISIDYTAAHNFNWLEPNKKTLLNLSDLFNHGPYIANLPLKYRIACENKILGKLIELDPNIILMLTSRAADGYELERTVQHSYGPVTSFEMTDISKLKKLPWHQNDWFNKGCKPLGVD